MKQVEVIKIIRVQWPRGKGTEVDPCRTVLQYWDFDGNLVWEDDALAVNMQAIIVSGVVPAGCPDREALVEKIQAIGAPGAIEDESPAS